jgi:hypothetical protein
LDHEGLLQSNQGRLECSELGKAMARYYVKFGTMQKILTLQERAAVPEVVGVAITKSIINIMLMFLSLRFCLRRKSSKISNSGMGREDSTRNSITALE